MSQLALAKSLNSDAIRGYVAMTMEPAAWATKMPVGEVRHRRYCRVESHTHKEDGYRLCRMLTSQGLF
jgi:hypothetical protein